MGAMPDDATIEAWVSQVYAHATVMRSLDDELVAQHELPLTWFDVLSRLKQADGQRLRLHELQEASVLTRSGITRLVDRIEAKGFVKRERSEEDRRGVYVVITQAGLDKLESVWRDHFMSIEQHFGRHLNAKDVAALKTANSKVLDAERPKR